MTNAEQEMKICIISVKKKQEGQIDLAVRKGFVTWEISLRFGKGTYTDKSSVTMENGSLQSTLVVNVVISLL